MKHQLSFLIAILLFTFSLSHAQDNPLEALAKRNQINHIPSSIDELRYQTFNYYLADIDSLDGKNFYNNAVLNNYFKGLITSYATNTGDLSFNNYFLQANSSAGTLTIGKSFRLDNMLAGKEKEEVIKLIRPVQKLTNLLTVYVRSNYSNGFSTLYSENSTTEEYNFSNNLGVGAKYTYVHMGTMGTKKANKIKKIRESFVQGKINSKITAYVNNQLSSELALMNLGVTDKSKLEEKKRKLIEKKFFEFYNEIIEEELKYIESQKLLSSSRTYWISLEGYVPVTRTEVLTSIDNEAVDKNSYRNFDFKANVNGLLNYNTNTIFKNFSIKGTLQAQHFKTNTFIANNQSAVSFQSVIQNNGDTIVQGRSDAVFLGAYDDFWATSLRGELVLLLFNNSIGLSAAAEEIYGDIENRNWKLGIPFSLKDKDGKPTVNFELQWRELYNDHSVGLSIGYNFGKFVQ